MESLRICGDLHKISDINIILINEQKQDNDSILYFISLFSKNGVFNYFSFHNRDLAQFQLCKLNEFMQTHCVYDFAIVNKSFLINMQNTKHVKLYANQQNECVVRATFTNERKIKNHTNIIHRNI